MKNEKEEPACFEELLRSLLWKLCDINPGHSAELKSKDNLNTD